jgi:hypothetical protein
MTTVDQFIAQLQAKLGKPYIYGGIGPEGYDCSGLIYSSCLELGINVPRTSEAQWAGLPRIAAPKRGCLILYRVPSDGSAQPAHVMVYLGPNLAIQAPHTGLDVEYSSIPNIAGVEEIMGYCWIPQLTDAPPAPPVVVPTLEDDMFTTDPQTGLAMGTDKDGNLYLSPGMGAQAPAVVTLAEHPEWKAGNAESWTANPCVGLVAERDTDGTWGYTYVTQPASGQGSWGIYDRYHVRRNGSV